MSNQQQDAKPLNDSTSELVRQEVRRKNLICLFGLSADPPTGYGGHVGIVQTLQQQNQWDEIWVMPVYRHTYKEKRERLVSFEHRFVMCQVAFAHLNQNENFVSTQQQLQTKVVISDAEYMSWKNAVKDIVEEVEKEKISVGTAALLDYLSSVYDDCTFSFCLGADSFIDLVHGKWQQTDRILNDLLFNQHNDINDCYNKYRRRLVVLYRSQTKIISVNDSSTDTNSDIPMHPSSSSTGSSEYLDHLLNLVEEYGVQLMRMDRSEDNISSTFVRNCFDVSKLQENPAVILPEVLRYIQQHKLYMFCK